jgi:hypothetical protein
MNLEKFNELEVKAQVQVYNPTTMSHDYQLNVQKLVELVVRECADLAVEGDLCISPRNRILDHFGVN